jgi:hypothetical protein
MKIGRDNMTNKKRLAKINAKHIIKGEMSIDGGFPPNNININLTIAQDARIRDIEKLFGEIQDKILLWTRDTDCDHLMVVDESEME